MAILGFQVTWLLLLCWNWTSYCNGTTVLVVFKEENFQGDKYETDSSENCTRIPDDFRIGHGSLLTSGCVAVYFDKLCLVDHYGFVVVGKENSIARVKARRNLHNESLFHPGNQGGGQGVSYETVDPTIQAYRDCRGFEGNPLPSLDYYNILDRQTVQERDICTCTDSRETYGFRGSMDLYGYCFKFYAEPKCTGEHTVKDSIQYSGYTVFKSFEPCQIPMACGKLKVRVFNVEPAFDSSRLPGRVDDEAVDAKQTFINNGTATMIELYDIGRVLTETAEISVSQSIRQLNAAASSVECEVSEEVVNKFDVKATAKAEGNLKPSIGKPSNPKPTNPTKKPTKKPTIKTTKKPRNPTKRPTRKPTTKPTTKPTKKPDKSSNNTTTPKPTKPTAAPDELDLDEPDPESDELDVTDLPDLLKVPTLEASVEASASYGIEKKVSKNLKDAFENKTKTESESTNSTENIVTTTKIFQVQKKIVMPACSQYEVSAFITIAHDVSLEYKMYFEVTGETPTFQIMSAEDIIVGLSRIPQRGLRVLKDHPRANNQTVIVESSLELKLNFGLNSVVKAEGKTLWDCIRRHKMCKCDCPRDGTK